MFKNNPTIPNGFVEIDPSGRYLRFKDILGKGAMKIVYRAFDVVLGMEVAWSQVMLNDVLCSSDELQRLYSEVHLLKSLNHQSIIRFYYSWIDIDHRTFNFITEMFTSGTLREYRQKYKQVDIRAIKNWARQILAGLVYLHSHDPPVIHRDLKCDNIFVNGHLGQVKIGDLGLAAILRGSQHAHSVIGTPEFMAPELYEEQYNELVDIYSFGMCMLEMFTSEYPYSECSNPAQIYKKVTSGKKPKAFHRIEDLEAKKFVAKCLETASKRLPACELLLDPFLATVEDQSAVSKLLLVYSPKGVLVELSSLQDVSVRRRNMTITGSVSWEDNTVFLKVQISDKDGCVRNVHFPFDIINDTSMDVAKEMVKELDITEWEPHEIAEMIEEEISALVPGLVSPKHLEQHIFDVNNEDDDENHPPSLSSSSHSCQSVQETRDPIQGRQMQNNNAISESSCSVGTYSNSEYSSDKYDDDSLGSETGHRTSNTKTEKYTRFGPQEIPNMKPNGKCKEQMNSGKGNRWSGNRKLSKLRSFMDVRSQLLHRALMQAVTKRSGAKTVGAVENIGYNDPC